VRGFEYSLYPDYKIISAVFQSSNS